MKEDEITLPRCRRCGSDASKVDPEIGLCWSCMKVRAKGTKAPTRKVVKVKRTPIKKAEVFDETKLVTVSKKAMAHANHDAMVAHATKVLDRIAEKGVVPIHPIPEASRPELGCCVDKACDETTCMNLPAGKTCGDCVHLPRCTWLIQATPERTDCDWFPRRFKEK